MLSSTGLRPYSTRATRIGHSNQPATVMGQAKPCGPLAMNSENGRRQAHVFRCLRRNPVIQRPQWGGPGRLAAVLMCPHVLGGLRGLHADERTTALIGLPSAAIAFGSSPLAGARSDWAQADRTAQAFPPAGVVRSLRFPRRSAGTFAGGAEHGQWT